MQGQQHICNKQQQQRMCNKQQYMCNKKQQRMCNKQQHMCNKQQHMCNKQHFLPLPLNECVVEIIFLYKFLYYLVFLLYSTTAADYFIVKTLSSPLLPKILSTSVTGLVPSTINLP